NIPGFSDVFKLGLDQPPTEEELSKYRSADPGELSVHRWQQVKAYKKRKKDSFVLRGLAKLKLTETSIL
ncbi:unnamed protein product, partial [marine sediment metagenome]